MCWCWLIGHRWQHLVGPHVFDIRSICLRKCCRGKTYRYGVWQ